MAGPNASGVVIATVRVVSDSACDLPAEIADSLGVTIVPLSIRFGADEYVDRKDLSPQAFWRKVAAASVLPETAAPSPGAFEAAFREAADDGCRGVVCICLSSKLSATIGAARLAAQAVGHVIDVRVVDSLSITMGQGTMVTVAARLALTGATLDEVERAATQLVGRTTVLGALDTLDNLKKGGRIGGAQALIGSLLQVKPIIDVSSGTVESIGKQRTRTKALAYLATLLAEAKAETGVENVAVMHGDAPDIEEFLDLLAKHYPKDKIIVGQIGAVIGTHGGPRVVGLTFNQPVPD